MHLHHIELAVADIDRSRRFFQNALGATVVPDPAQDPNFAWINLGKCEILLRLGTPGPKSRFPGTANIVLCVEDLAKHHKRLLDRDIPTDKDREDVVFQDPDGHWFQLVGIDR